MGVAFKRPPQKWAWSILFRWKYTINSRAINYSGFPGYSRTTWRSSLGSLAPSVVIDLIMTPLLTPLLAPLLASLPTSLSDLFYHLDLRIIATVLPVDRRQPNPRQPLVTILSLMHHGAFVLHGTKNVAFIGENISIGFLSGFPPFNDWLVLLFLHFGRKRHQVDPPLLSRLRQHNCVHKRVQRLHNLLLLKLQIHLVNELIEGCRIAGRNILQPDSFLFANQLIDAIGLIRHLQAAQLVGHHPQGPDIALLVITLLFVPDLGADVKRRASFSLGKVTIGNDLRYIQISNLEDSVLCLEDVGWFDISMNDAILMQKLQP